MNNEVGEPSHLRWWATHPYSTCDCVIKSNKTAEDGGNVSNNGCHKTDGDERTDEAQPALEDLRRRQEGKQYL